MRRIHLLAVMLLILVTGACDREPAPPPLDPQTAAAAAAVEEKAGSFLEYYATVLDLAQRHTAQPDSFVAELERLPGTHLTEDEWNAWVAPHAADPRPMADELEALLAELASRR